MSSSENNSKSPDRDTINQLNHLVEMYKELIDRQRSVIESQRETLETCTATLSDSVEEVVVLRSTVNGLTAVGAYLRSMLVGVGVDVNFSEMQRVYEDAVNGKTHRPSNDVEPFGNAEQFNKTADEATYKVSFDASSPEGEDDLPIDPSTWGLDRKNWKPRNDA